MTGVVVGMETDEIAIKDPKEDLATDGKDPTKSSVPRVSVLLPY